MLENFSFSALVWSSLGKLRLHFRSVRTGEEYLTEAFFADLMDNM